MIDTLNDNDFDYVNSLSKNTDTIMDADPDIATNFFEAARNQINLNSYTYAKEDMDKQLQKAYLSRDSEMREQHIIPEADVTNGDFSADNLNVIDQQIQKLNQTTRADKPFLTNDEIKQNIANKVRRLQYETAVDRQNEGFFGNIATHVLSKVGSAPYSYKRTLVDAAANLALFAGSSITAGLSGGLSLAAETGIGAGAFAASNAYDTTQENAALKEVGLDQKSVKGAALQGAISGALMAPIGFGFQKLGGVIGRSIGKRIAKNLGKESADGLVQAAHATTDIVEKDSSVPPMLDGLSYKPSTKISYKNLIQPSEAFDQALTNADPDVRAAAIDKIGNTDQVRQQYEEFKNICKISGKL